jgi:hypothetical protein
VTHVTSDRARHHATCLNPHCAVQEKSEILQIALQRFNHSDKPKSGIKFLIEHKCVVPNVFCVS